MAFLRRFPWILALCAPLMSIGCATAPPVTKLYAGQRIVTRRVHPDAYEHATRAMLYVEHELFNEAAQELKLAIDFDAESPELHARLAEVYVLLERYKNAESEVQASLALAPTAAGYLAKAHLLRAREDFSGALDALVKARELVDFRDRAEQAEEIYQELAVARIEHLDLEAAHAILDELCGSLPEAEAAQLKRMAVAWAQGDMGKARRPLREALDSDPNLVDAWLALAWIESADGHRPEATRAFREALERSEGALEVAAAYARFLVGAGDVAAAAQVAEEYAVPLPMVDKESVRGRIELERSARRLDRALALAIHGRTMDVPTEEKDRLVLVEAGLRKETGETEKAIALLLALGKESSVFLEARLRAAELLRDAGRTAEAKARVEEAAGDAKDSLDVVASLAFTDEKSGDTAKALERMQTFLRAHAGNTRAHLTLAMILERMGKATAALEEIEGLVKKQPGNVELLNFWGFVAADHQLQLPLAKKRIEAAVALEPGAGGMLDSLGWAHFRMGEMAKAQQFLEQAGRLEPQDAEIQFHLGEFFLARGDRDQALARFRRALSQGPEDRLRRKIEKRIVEIGQVTAP